MSEDEIQTSPEQASPQDSQKCALITGISGQDGFYLTQLLLEKGYSVHGVVRKNSPRNSTVNPRVHLHFGDLGDADAFTRIISLVRPHEVYNLGAQSHVKDSFSTPAYTADINAVGTLRILDAITKAGLTGFTRFYQASSSELYGNAVVAPQTEDTAFHPRSPYGVSKQFAYWITVNYREAYGMYTSNGILFNHESPHREKSFVTRKITDSVAKISLGQQECLYLGNIDAKRDWGHARDYVEGMWRMLQQDAGDDYVLATGEVHSVRDFLEVAFTHVDMTLSWSGHAEQEVGTDQHGVVRVRIDPAFYRPTEVFQTYGDPSKAKRLLKWAPKVSFADIVREMVAADLLENSTVAECEVKYVGKSYEKSDSGYIGVPVSDK
ncbi:MAG: hypothetical protein SGCHY_002851 [Lobulomycetales sp.]